VEEGVEKRSGHIRVSFSLSVVSQPPSDLPSCLLLQNIKSTHTATQH
jgi:hypothetical protein